MVSAASIAKEIDRIAPLTVGSLYFFGDCFGRPGDNIHEVRSAHAGQAGPGQPDRLVICFNQGETLTVAEPRGLTLGPDVLEIAHARRVTWRWFYYGRPQRTENLYTIDYKRVGIRLVIADTTDWYEAKRRAKPSAAAVRTALG